MARVLRWSLAVLLVVAVVATVLGVWTIRRAFPQYGGELRLPALKSPVTVYRDDHGIPHVYADSADDLFTAQGYLHAQDRFWEMDFRRHLTAGRLAELFGGSQVDTDAYLRTMGWRRVAEQEWRRLGPETRRWLTAYADGVNAWLGTHSGPDASLEYALLGVQNPGYTIEPWHPVDSLAWLKAMAWDLRTNMADEIERAVMRDRGLTDDQISDLFPPYPADRHPPIVPDTRPGDAAGGAGGGMPATLPVPADGPAPTGGPDPSAGRGAPDRPEVAGLLDGLGRATDRLPALLGTGPGIGSNSWVLAGSRTASGKPILANDPHLAPSLPGIWYQMGLHCTKLSDRCPYRVAGFTFSGVPGVVIGHNQRIAWGFTNLGPDVTDLYLERTDGDRYLVDGEWRPMRVRTETLKVAGGDDVEIRVRHTHHGPVMSDRSEQLAGIGGRYAVALRWTALDPGRTGEAIFVLNRARNWRDFRAAARLLEVPAQNLVYADVDGNIGYQAPGRIPIRGAGDGRWPAPGWDSRYDWKGFIPFEDLPREHNPERGYIVTANQAVVGPSYPHLLTHDWAYGYRSHRITDLITGHPGPITVTATGGMQSDSHNGGAAMLLPHLLRVRVPDRVEEARGLLRDWDLQQPAGSAAAAYYNAVWRHLLSRTFEELPVGHRPDGGSRWFEVVRGLLTEPGSAWWDDQRTNQVETADDILAAALRDADADLRDRLGDDPAQWRWGDLHTLTLRHGSFGSSGIPPVEWLFNEGSHPVAGGGGTVNANAWNAEQGYEVTAVPSMRMVVDLSDLDGSLWVQLTGNSGHAFEKHYDDQFELWRTGRYLPMRWDRDRIEERAEHTLVLRPR